MKSIVSATSPPNNGMHSTEDTIDFKFLLGGARRVMPTAVRCT
jgi:hypothetical protein